MTCIAYDGTTLAADKRMTDAGIGRTVTKIWRASDGLRAFSGDCDVGHAMVDWHRSGAKHELFPEAAKEDGATLLFISNAGVIHLYGKSPFPTPIETSQIAIGSGRDFAEAAMYLGHSAVKAVETACAFDTPCGNGIDTLTLKETS